MADLLARRMASTAALMPSLLHNFTTGIVAGKLAADAIFSGIAISAY